MRISDWSSDVCSSDLEIFGVIPVRKRHSSSNEHHRGESGEGTTHIPVSDAAKPLHGETRRCQVTRKGFELTLVVRRVHPSLGERSEEHTSELQSLMRNSYAVFCLKQKNKQISITTSASGENNKSTTSCTTTR